MFRVKIGAVATAVVLALNIVVYLAIISPLATEARTDVEAGVKRASKLAVVSQELNGFKLLSLTESVAQRPEFQSWVRIDEERERRIAVFDAIDQYDKKLKEQQRKAHFFAVVGGDGAVIARDIDPKNMYGEKLPFRNVKVALEGTAQLGVWFWKNRMMRSAAAPIWVDGQVEGAVVIAYDITAAEARAERDMFGTHVAYFYNNAVRASSFSLQNDDDREDAGKVEALTEAVLNGQGAPGLKALEQDKPSEVFPITLEGEEFLAITGPLPAPNDQKKPGYVVLCSLTKAMAPVKNTRYMILLLLVLQILLVLAVITLTVRHYDAAEDVLELGVSDVINGNLEYSFESVNEFEGLANGINVMLNRLLGRPEPSEEGLDDGDGMADSSLVIYIEEPADDDPEETARLAAEPEEDYLYRLVSEYLEARKQQGLAVEGLDLEALSRRIKANARLLRAKYECGEIRFLVKSEPGRVSLRPVRVNRPV